MKEQANIEIHMKVWKHLLVDIASFLSKPLPANADATDKSSWQELKSLRDSVFDSRDQKEVNEYANWNLNPPIRHFDRLQIYLKVKKLTVFHDEGGPPGYTGAQADIVLSEGFWDNMLVRFGYAEPVQHMAEYARLYRPLDHMFRETTFHASPGDVEATAQRIQSSVWKWRQHMVDHLDMYGESNYGHYLDHAADLYRIHAEHTIAFGSLGSGSHEHHVKDIKGDIRDHGTVYTEERPKVVHLSKLQCDRVEPTTREMKRGDVVHVNFFFL